VRRAQLEHVIRAAATIADDDELIIVGSQAVLGQFPNAPDELCVSNEADVFPKNKPERWELIDGTLGELSPFHETFGYYAQGIEEGTAILPDGWRNRLIPVRSPDTRGATGYCLEIHDLVVSKYVANREKDRRFVRGCVAHRMITAEIVAERLKQTRLPDERLRPHLEALIAADFAAAAPA
jgi:hypothetical protein